MIGVINLHKPIGPTSRDCVTSLQRLSAPFKVGHAGTLDPIASGVLLMLIGPAVRLMDDYHMLDKEYVGTFVLGVTSASADTETEMLPMESPMDVTQSAFEFASRSFVGTITQTPPIFSAIRIGGRRAHSLARSGATIEMPSREVNVESIDIVHFDYPHVTIRVVCGTGTYIRSIGRDIARSLGSDAVMTSLVRTRIGPFRLEESHTPETLTSRARINDAMSPPQEGLRLIPHIALEEKLLERFRFGQHIELESHLHQSIWPHHRFAAHDPTGKFHGIIRFNPTHDVWEAEKYLLQPSYFAQLSNLVD